MEYADGVLLEHCRETMEPGQKRQTAADLAKFQQDMLRLTSTIGGSLLDVRKIPRSRRYGEAPEICPSAKVVEDLTIGPLNDVTLFETPPDVAPADARLPPIDKCGPFETQLALVSAIAYRGDTQFKTTVDSMPIVALLDLYEAVQDNTSPACFYFTHGDIHAQNIFVSPSSGAVTALIDWEMAGFRPIWLSGPTTILKSDLQTGLQTPLQDPRTPHDLEVLIYRLLCEYYTGNKNTGLTDVKALWVQTRSDDFPLDILDYFQRFTCLWNIDK